MPEHGLLSCCIELGESNTRLREYDTKYANKTVETYVAIPSQPTPFAIRLNTKGYISLGLAVYVFIDGVYQANRNKRSIKQPTLDDPNAANFEVRLGKKEDLLKDGRVIARGWWFEKLNIVPVDTKATINEDVLNNIGTIEVVVLRCQDNPKNVPVNPFDFPKLPVLVKPTPAIGNTKSSSRQDRKAAFKKSKEKESSDDGGMFGGMGIFDGAADDPREARGWPTGIVGHYDTRPYRSHRIDERSGRRRHESPRRTENPRQRILEEESPRTVTSADEEHRPKARPERLVHFESPLVTRSRKPPSDSLRWPSGSHYSRHGRDEPHPHLLRRRSPSPESKPPRELLRSRYSDKRDPYPDRDERRQNSPVRAHHVLDGRDEHYRRQRLSGDSIYERSRSRSSVGGRGRFDNFDETPRRSGSSVWSRSSSEDRGRKKDYERRGRRGNIGSARERSWSWSSNGEQSRRRDYDIRDRRRDRSIEENEPDLRALAASFLQHVPQASEQGSRTSRGHRKLSPSPDRISHDYPDQPKHSSRRKSSKSHPVQTRNTSPVASRALPSTETHQPIQQTGIAHHPSSGRISFFEDNCDPTHEAYLAPGPQKRRESTAGFAAQTYNSHQTQTPAANQYGLGPVPTTYGHNILQPASQQNPFPSQRTLPGQIGSGQQTGNRPWSVNKYPQQPMQSFPEAQAFRPPQAQTHFPATNAPQGPQNGQIPIQPYRNMSGSFDQRFPSQYEQTGQAAQTQGRMPNHVGRPSQAPVAAAENPQSLISIIQQLKDLGVISVPGQDNNPRGRRKTASGHRLTCPQNGDRTVNPSCLKHGDHAQSAQQHFATWMTGGNPDPAQGKEWFQHLASEHIACTCEPHQKLGPCTCRSGGGGQGSGSGSKSDKRPDGSNDRKDNNDKQGEIGGWGNQGKNINGQSSGWGDQAKTEPNNTSWGDTQPTSGDATSAWGTGNTNNHQSSNDATQPNADWGATAPDAGKGGDDHAWNNGGNQSNSGGAQQNNDWNKTDTNKTNEWDNNNNNPGWDNNNNNPESKKDKPSRSNSNSKLRKSCTAKERDDKAPAEEKPYTRSYWKSNETVADSANSGKKRGQHYTMPEDPIYTLSESRAKEFNVRHQVRGGMGLEEKKKTHRPLYLDNFDEPYAVFRFKYRSRDMLKKILGEDVKESPEEFQEWLSALSKEQLIAEMLRKKESGAWKSDDGSGDEGAAGSGKEKREGDKGGNSGGDNTSWGDGDAATGSDSGGWKDNNQTTTTPAAGDKKGQWD